MKQLKQETKKMGFMSKLFGSGKLDATNGSSATQGHNISKDAALQHTDRNVPSPQNADFTSIRTVPVLPAPRYFNAAEARALEALALEKKKMAKEAVKSYRAMREIDSADTEVHETHRQYQARLAKNEAKKLGANTKLAEQLHAQRSHYQELQSRVDVANQAAIDRINAIRNSYGK
ncbi:MAG TPA: hypothetical protein V6D12_01805 [Candidatus Obscuribacterales bacterium]